MRRRRIGALVDPHVKDVDEAIHQARQVEPLNLAAAAGEALVARVTDPADFVHPLFRRREPLLAQDARVRALVRQIARRHVAGHLVIPDVVVHLVRDVDLRHECRAIGGAREQHVLAVLHQHRQPRSCGRIVGEDAVEVPRAAAIDVEPRRVVQIAADAGARRMPVEIREARRLAEAIRDDRARDVAEVGDVVRRIVERQRVDRRPVLERRLDLAEPFG